MHKHHRGARLARGLIVMGVAAITVAAAACTPPSTGGGSTTTTSTTTTTTTLPSGGGGGPLGSPWLLVADTNLGEVHAFDTRDLSLQRTISVGGPIGPSIAMVGTKLFYSVGSQWGSVGEYDLVTGANNRTAINMVYGGGVLRSSPALPGRLFVGEPGLSPADVAVYDVTGAVPDKLTQTPFSSIGSNLIDFTISADGTRLWLACGAPYGLTEVSTSNLATTGKFFATGAYPQGVASVRTASAEYLAGVTAPYGQLSIFDASNPTLVAAWDTTPGSNPTYQRNGVGWSPDGATAYAVQAGYAGTDAGPGRLLSVNRTTGATTTTSPVFGAGFTSDTFGQLLVDPGTHRVFVSGANEIDVFNANGTRSGTITGQAGARGMALTATSLVDLPPNPSIAATPATPVAGQQVQLTATPTTTEPIVSTTWNFGDSTSGSNIASGATTTHTFNAPGTYVVTTTETDDEGATGTTSQTITVARGVIPAIAVTTTSPISGHPVAFSGSGSVTLAGSIAGYTWNFGDPTSPSNTASGVAPSHTFASAGTYTVTLTVTGSSGESESTTTTVVIAPALVPKITFAPASPIEGQLVLFSSSGTTSDPVVSTTWNFGDPTSGSNSASGANAGHVFPRRGTFTVSVTQTDSAGATGTITATVVVGSSITASFTATPQTAYAGQSVHFDASASTDSAGSITAYSWTFGGDSPPETATGVSPSFAFSNPGTHPVTLTVTGHGGETMSTTVNVTIVPAIVARATFTPQNPSAGQTITFSAAGSTDAVGSIVEYDWYFGDTVSGASNATGVTATHAFTSNGQWYVGLVVKGASGEYETTTVLVTVGPPGT